LLYEIDLHGLTVDEALFKVDQYLYDTYQMGLREISIVHGKGTGTLRSAIRNYIGTHPLVRSYRRGGDNEGGDGVTIVELQGRRKK